MSYKALLFCPDDKTARVVTQVLSDLEFRVEPCNEPFAAVKKLMAEHYDAIVVDCENEQNAALLFKSAHNSGSNQASLAVAVVEGQAGVAKAFRIGANLVLTKPINVEQSKSTLRVARGLLRKGDAAKPAAGTPATQSSPRPAATSFDAKRPSAPAFLEPKSGPTSLPAQPSPSPIPAVSASLFDVEEDPAPKPEPAEAALLESMPDPLGKSNRMVDPAPMSPASKEYPWQPVSKPAAGPMATALRRAAEAAGRSEVDSSAASKIPASPASFADAPTSRSYTSSMASGQAAATAPAKTPTDLDEEAVMPQLDAPTFSSLGGTSSEHAAGGGKKTILIAAAVLVAAAAVGYVGWSRMHSSAEVSVTQRLTAHPQTAPAQIQTPGSAAVPPSAQDLASASPSQPSSSTSALPVEQMPDITLSTNETHPPALKKTTSIVASNTVIRNPVETDTPAPMVVRNEASHQAPSHPAAEEPAQPPALGSLNIASNTTDQALSGMMNTSAANLPQPAQKLKVSQGVSQGLLIKSVQPEYPQQAMQMHTEGAVQLLANIGKDGSITAVKLIKGDSVLAHAAIDAVKQWKYKPYYLNDQPVEIQTQITVNFKLP
jgi:periplasmic protein TonB